MVHDAIEVWETVTKKSKQKSTLGTHTLFYYVHTQTIHVFTTKANNLSLSLSLLKKELNTYSRAYTGTSVSAYAFNAYLRFG